MTTLLSYARAAWRMLRFLLLIVRGFAEARALQHATQDERSAWMRSIAQRGLRVLHVEVVAEGDVPRAGLLVSNHLSYLDILAYSAVAAPVFLSKAEVAKWPVLGVLCRATGSLFVRRESRADAVQVQRQLTDVLREGRLVLVFPEGTTTAGDAVQTFHAPMFQAALDAAVPVHTAAVAYTLPGVPASAATEQVRDQVHYWGDMVIGPHVLRLMRLKAVQATIRFASEPVAAGNRRALAAAAQQRVTDAYQELRGTAAAPDSPTR